VWILIFFFPLFCFYTFKKFVWAKSDLGRRQFDVTRPQGQFHSLNLTKMLGNSNTGMSQVIVLNHVIAHDLDEWYWYSSSVGLGA
jgi:hypothetical protein